MASSYFEKRFVMELSHETDVTLRRWYWYKLLHHKWCVII